MSRVIETCSRADTRLAGTRRRNPRRGEVLSGELRVLFDRDSEEPTTVGRFAARPG